MALKLSNVATFLSTLSKHLVDLVQIISTTFRLYQDSKGSRCWEALLLSTRSHAHSKRFGLNVDLAAELETDFAWVPPFHLLLLKLHMLMIGQSLRPRLIRHLTVLRKRLPRDVELEGRTSREVLEGKIVYDLGPC